MESHKAGIQYELVVIKRTHSFHRVLCQNIKYRTLHQPLNKFLWHLCVIAVNGEVNLFLVLEFVLPQATHRATQRA